MGGLDGLWEVTRGYRRSVVGYGGLGAAYGVSCGAIRRLWGCLMGATRSNKYYREVMGGCGDALVIGGSGGFGGIPGWVGGTLRSYGGL